MKSQSKNKTLIPIYGAFLVSGIMALLVGSILPYIMEEKGINYSEGGSILSAFAIGNFLASFINPWLCEKIGRKWTVICLTVMIPISFCILCTLPPLEVMYVLLLLIGIGRGSCSVFSNSMVNDICPGKPSAISLLHTTFAVGAFLAPFLTTICIGLGFNWRVIVYLLIALWLIADIGYISISKSVIQPVKKNKQGKTDYSFLKNADFYIMGFILFFYLGVENCVNGWFITYFQDSGIMSDAYATNLVSIVWVMVMAGRLINAKISSKIKISNLVMLYCISTAVFFFLLIATRNLAVITVAIVGLGFFLAGIYPTCIGSMGKALQGSTAGMAYLLAMAALGGIITPKIVGIVADYAGMNAAIGVLIVNVAGMLVLAFFNKMREKK